MGEIKTNVAQVRFLVEEEAGRCLLGLQQQHVPGIPKLRYGALRFDLADDVTRQDRRSPICSIGRCMRWCMRARTWSKSARWPNAVEHDRLKDGRTDSAISAPNREVLGLRRANGQVQSR